MSKLSMPPTIENVKLYLSEWSLSVIPLSDGSKQPSVSWKEFQNRKMAVDEIEKYDWHNVGIVTGTVSRLVVIDADTDETVVFLNNFDEFKSTAVVKTRRGLHYYFTVDNLPHDFGNQKIYKGNVRIDIKANGGYVVAPPSTVDGHEYQWVNQNGSGSRPFLSLNFSDFQALLWKIQEKLGQSQKYKQEQKELIEHIEIDFKKLEKILKKHYHRGNRQNIAIYTAGLLAKSGYSLDDAIALVSKIATERGDEEIKTRIAGIRHTYQDYENGKTVKGLLGLKELGIKEIEKIFEVTENVRVTIPNITELLYEYCVENKIQIDYDQFYVKIFVNDREINREVEVNIQSALEKRIEKRIPDEVFLKAIESIAYANKRDRLKEFLIECKEKWDGTPRIHTFFNDAFGTPINQYTVSISKNFFVSAVARAFNPGCFQKHIIVIQGGQDIGKSMALMALGKQFHREINVSVTTEKDFFMAIQGVWIAEIPEMDALRKADRNRVKAIISSTIDRFRPPYSRHMKDFPRRCIFTCTTNDQVIFEDPTGGTRFWAIEAPRKANIEYIEQYREQFFGEAVWEYEKGYEYWRVDERAAKNVQENVRRHDEWEQIITEFVFEKNLKTVTVSHIASNCLKIEPKDLDKSKQMRIAECLTLLGFRKKTIWQNHKAQKVWVLEEQSHLEQEVEPF